MSVQRPSFHFPQPASKPLASIKKKLELRASYKASTHRLNAIDGQSVRQCYVCGCSTDRFLPLFKDSTVSEFHRLFRVISSDVDNFYCPHCQCFDRERHLLMYFDTLGLWDRFSGLAILHIAPERLIRQRLKQLDVKEYVMGDLSPSSEEVKRIDVTAIPFPDAHFDLVICNHVLEHVPADSLALAEISRVLVRGGLAILQTPYSSLLANTFQDPNINTDELRKCLYGQEDHVRLYGLDLFTKIQSHGFELDIRRHQDVLPEYDGRRFGINEQEKLILARKI